MLEFTEAGRMGELQLVESSRMAPTNRLPSLDLLKLLSLHFHILALQFEDVALHAQRSSPMPLPPTGIANLGGGTQARLLSDRATVEHTQLDHL